MATRIQFRRDTAASWASVNPVLRSGEPGYETDTGKSKIGDGTTAWISLVYVPDAVQVAATYSPLLTPVSTFTWNSDGTIATQTIGGVTTTFTWNSDGTLATETRAGVTRTYTYSGGTLASVA